MKKVKWIALCTLLCAAVLLSGCQLALPDGGEAAQDRLIGVFLTWDYLDLFDHEAFLEDNLGKIAQGKNVTADGAAYQGRLYAARQDNHDFLFEGVEGMRYFAADWTDELGNTAHILCGDPGISGGTRHYHIHDEGETVTLTGTVYVTPEGDERVLYINPVYQTADGQVYAVQGSGTGFSSMYGGFTSKMEESVTVTDEAGNVQSCTVRLEIAIEAMTPAQEIRLIEMTADHTVLHETVFAPADAPESMALHEECAYLLQENVKADTVERQIYSAEDEYARIYAPRQNGVMVETDIRLLWQAQ